MNFWKQFHHFGLEKQIRSPTNIISIDFLHQWQIHKFTNAVNWAQKNILTDITSGTVRVNDNEVHANATMHNWGKHEAKIKKKNLSHSNKNVQCIQTLSNCISIINITRRRTWYFGNRSNFRRGCCFLCLQQAVCRMFLNSSTAKSHRLHVLSACWKDFCKPLLSGPPLTAAAAKPNNVDKLWKIKKQKMREPPSKERKCS